MSAENNNVIKPDESRNANQTVDKSRRSFARMGAVAPVIMTLASKTALGETPYNLTVSGQNSGNLSSHPGTTTYTLGFSPGAWKTPSESGDGSLAQWSAANCSPYTLSQSRPYAVAGVFQNNAAETVKTDSDKTFGSLKAKDAYNSLLSKHGYVNATTFSSIFGGTNDQTLHAILMSDSGSLEFHAVADYLNAKLHEATGEFSPVYDNITPGYIVAVYNDTKLTDDQKKNYFISIHH